MVVTSPPLFSQAQTPQNPPYITLARKTQVSSPSFMALISSPPANPKPLFLSASLPTLRRAKPLAFCSNVRNSRLNSSCGYKILKLNFHDIRKRDALQKVGALATKVAESEPEESDNGDAFNNYRRILLSDVAVTRPRSVFHGRKWNSLDLGTAGIVLAMHILSLFAPFCFNWSALWVAVAFYVITGLFGITLSFHRNLSHRSFKLPKWLEYSFAYCGVLALQGNPIDWVSTHRYHHQFCDSERDPHSPLEGFWFSHMNWLFDTSAVAGRCGGPNNVVDLQKQPFYRFLQTTYIAHPIGLGLLLYALGGVPFVVWGMGVRTVWVYHITWLVNSACHVWGKQAWNTGDLSRNNWWVALLSFGEGWHNNHHAFEYSARHGLEWWQIDMTWYMVRLLQAIGLAKDVKLPNEIQKQRLTLT